MSSDNQFTALGPTEIGFQTNGSNIRIGVEVTGREIGVRGRGDTSFGVEGTGAGGGVHGKGGSVREDTSPFIGRTAVGVLGDSTDDNGVRGISDQNDGVAGFANSLGKSGVFGFNSHKNMDEPGGTSGELQRPKQTGFGVFGRCDLVDGAGVGGRSEGTDPVTGSGGVGVIGTSQARDGIVGISDARNKSGVYGFNSKTSEGLAFGVFGRCDAPEGAGVSGRNDSKNGDAVSGFSPEGYGGHFIGGRAPLRLNPANTLGHPTTGNHQSGEFFVDSNGKLFYCMESGTPGNWFRVQLLPA